MRGLVDETDIIELGEKIAQKFNPLKIILFGSYAYGTPQPDSDIDIMVVLPFDGKNFRKSLEIINTVNPSFSVDILARRPEDVQRRYDEGDPLIRDVLDRGKVIYERHG